MKAIPENFPLLDPNLSRLGGGGIKKNKEKKIKKKRKNSDENIRQLVQWMVYLMKESPGKIKTV